jgi:hypothetical protein
MSSGTQNDPIGGRREERPHAPHNVEEALQQALAHARDAAAEALLAARCLLDAACIALYREPARLSAEEARTRIDVGDARLALAAMARGLDELSASLRSDAAAPVPDAVMQAILDALDVEIGRWEQRSRQDGDARGVLRAFLGLREILWEFGVRPADEGPRTASKAEAAPENADWRGSRERIASALQKATAEAAAATSTAAAAASATSEAPNRGPRVQRVEVRG